MNSKQNTKNNSAQPVLATNADIDDDLPVANAEYVSLPSPYDMNPELYERDSLDILRAIRGHYGDEFRLKPVPSNPGEKFDFWFKIDGGEKIEFFFLQFDYGVKFISADPANNFLPLEFVDGAEFDHGRLEMSACIQEKNRCFFLALGVAIGLHPLAFEVAYRKHATMILDAAEPDDLCVMATQSVLERDEFVDCMAIASMWPREFDDYQILIVNIDMSGSFNQAQGFTHFRPPIASKIDAETGKWLGKDIVLTLQGGHFTYLTPTGANIIDHPVDTMLQYARRGRFQIATPMDFFAPSFEEADRISLVTLLSQFLDESEIVRR